MKMIIEVDITKVRRKMPPCGEIITPKKGKGAYRRKDKQNRKWGE